MKIERSKEWWLALARREGDAAVGAGVLVAPHEENYASSSTAEGRIAFGKFVNLMRRRKGFSVEKLADEADLDVGDIVSIEDDVQYTPDPRTVYKLAQTFGVGQKPLMQLAGLATPDDSSLRQHAVRFAARSESVEKLTREQKAALEAFVAVLSEYPDPKKAR